MENIDYVVCPICYKQFKTLPSHIVRGHKIDMKIFLEKYPNIQLVSDALKKQVSNSCKESECGSWLKGITLSDERKKQISTQVLGEKNPFYGKKHTDETRKLMSDNHADFTGDKNPFKKWINESQENKDSFHEASTQGWIKLKNDPIRYAKHIENLSNSIANAHLEGKIKTYGRGHKSGFFESKKFLQLFYYRSSYELNFIKICEEYDFIFDLAPPYFKIKYTSIDGYNKNYIPDFILNKKYLVELKPYKLLNYDNNPLKFKAGNNYCENNNLVYVLLTEKELSLLNDINDSKEFFDVFSKRNTIKL